MQEKPYHLSPTEKNIEAEDRGGRRGMGEGSVGFNGSGFIC